MNCYIKYRDTAMVLSKFLSKKVNISKPKPTLKEFRFINVKGVDNV